MRSCRCCEEDCAGGHSARNNAAWWVDFSGGFTHLSPEYQQRFCEQQDRGYWAFQSIGVQAEQFLPSFEPLRDSILVQGPGAPNWTTCSWQNYVGRVDRWQYVDGYASWNEYCGTGFNCMPEAIIWDSIPLDYRTWRLANPDAPFNSASLQTPDWYGPTPEVNTLANHCQNDHPDGVGERNDLWQFRDIFLGWQVIVEHVGANEYYGDKRQKLQVYLYLNSYLKNDHLYFGNWPYGQTPDEFDFQPGVNQGFCPEYYDARSNWHEIPVGDGSTKWIDLHFGSETFFTGQPVGRPNVLFHNEDFRIRQCQALTLLDGRANYTDLGTSNTVDDHWRLWETEPLEGDQIDGVTPLVLNFVEPSNELNWWHWFGIVNLPETLTLTPIKVDELIDLTGEEPQEEPEE